MKLVFYVPLVLIVYTWLGYPLCLLIMRFARRATTRDTSKQGFPPSSITILVTVHNEEKLIRSRLENLTRLESHDNLRFLIVSDGSTDQTDAIVNDVVKRDRRFQLFRTL